MHGGSYAGWVDKYWIDGADYPYDAANADWGAGLAGGQERPQGAPYPQTYDSWTPAGRALDDLTVDQWLAANVPGGLSSRFAKLMQSNAVAEYGLDPPQQSALNFIYLLGWNAQNTLSPINGADEKYSVRGGNDQLDHPDGGRAARGTVRTGRRLVAVRALADGRVRLTFATVGDDASTSPPTGSCSPCRSRRCATSTSARRAAGRSPAQAIQELGLGANAKLHLGVRRRPWVEQGYGGAVYTNVTGFQCGWDDTADQPLPGGRAQPLPRRQTR